MRNLISFSVVFGLAFCSSILALPKGQTKSPPAHRPARAPAPILPPVTLPAEAGLYAVIYTSMGNIVCRLFEKEAPKTVTNFRGLATGVKPWTDPVTGKRKHTPLYPGTTFHRVLPKFMIQGGDPTGTGTGSPGYEFENEIDPNRTFDRLGVLAMANHGPNTNGCQFFITVAPAPHLNGNYSIFGEVVSGQDVANAISEVPRDGDDKPLTPVKILAISIRMVAGTKASAIRPIRPIRPRTGRLKPSLVSDGGAAAETTI